MHVRREGHDEPREGGVRPSTERLFSYSSIRYDRMATVNIGGNTIYYEDAGFGDPVVLIHGTGFNATVWNKVFEPLAQQYRVIAYDRRAHGISMGAPPERADYFRQHADDAAMLIDLLSATPATVVGWSAGAIVALHLALSHPDYVGRLVLYEPSLHVSRDSDRGMLPAYLKFMLARSFGLKEKAAQLFCRIALGYRDGRNSYDSFDPDFVKVLSADAATLLAEVAAGTGEELTSEMLASGISVPVALLQGEHSPSYLHRAVARVASIFPGAPLIQIPKAAHLAQMDAPEEFMSALDRAISAA